MPISSHTPDSYFVADAITVSTLFRLSWSALRANGRTFPSPRPEGAVPLVPKGKPVLPIAEYEQASDQDGAEILADARRISLDEADH